MPLPITPERCAAIYDALRAFPPYSGWALPESDAIEFHVSKRTDIYGQYHYGADHAITVSSSLVGHWGTLTETIAHEMIHLHQSIRNTQGRAEHNREWTRLARQVCRMFGFDERRF